MVFGQFYIVGGKKEKKEDSSPPGSGDRREIVRSDKPKSGENPLVTQGFWQTKNPNAELEGLEWGGGCLPRANI